MSDEPTPTPTPSLRLKPRIRPDASTTPPPSIPKIAIAQPLDADGVLSGGERKVFSSPAPAPAAEAPANHVAAESEPAQPKKITLTPKLTGDSAPKRFTVPAATPTNGQSAKRIPLSIGVPSTPTPGSGEDGPPHEDESAHSAPTKLSYAASVEDDVEKTDDEVASSQSHASSEHDDSEEAPTVEANESATETAHNLPESEDGESHAADANSSDADETSTTPHPAVDVPTRFSPPPSEGTEVGRFKLKPRLNAPENPPLNGGVSLPSAIPGAGHVTPPPGIKIVPTAPMGLSSSSLPAKVALQPRAAADGTRRVRRVVVKSEKPRILKFLLITFGVLAGGGMAVGGFIGFRYLAQLEKHPSTATPVVVAHVPVKKAPAHSAPEKEVSGPQSAAGKLVAQAKAVANAEMEEVDSVTNEATGSAQTPAPQTTANSAQATTTAAKANGMNGTTTSAIATAAVAAGSTAAVSTTSSATPANAGELLTKPVVHAAEPKKNLPPSAEFRALIVNLRVSGVFQGAHPRALLNGRLMNAGEILDQSMLIRFTGIDAVHKQLMFEDGTGAQMQRHY